MRFFNASWKQLMLNKFIQIKIPLTTLFLMLAVSTTSAGPLTRDFTIKLPLFKKTSAWGQTAENVDSLPESDNLILSTYRILRGDFSHYVVPDGDTPSSWPNISLETNEWTIPIFKAKSNKTQISLRTYSGYKYSLNTFTNDIGDIGISGNKIRKIIVDSPANIIRPSLPKGRASDGHLVLYNPQTRTEWDYWNATSKWTKNTRKRPLRKRKSTGGGISSNRLLQAGSVAKFKLNKSGISHEGQFSARASGTPLMAGLLIPEDFKMGSIRHALSFAIPGPKNTCTAPYICTNPHIYPATHTEDTYYSTNINAITMGQRIRLKSGALKNKDGQTINEKLLSPATRKVLKALRNYGAYLVDNSGGFTFYAEDSATGKLDVNLRVLNWYIREPKGTPLPANKTAWQVLIEKVSDELSQIPIAFGNFNGHNASTATISHYNFEVIEPATPFYSTY